jgi:hypothetical protein
MFGLIVMPLLGAHEVWQCMTAIHDEGENFVSDTYCCMTLKVLWRFFLQSSRYVSRFLFTQTYY